MGNLQNQPLILASSSIYRRDLLARLGLPFEAISPEVDECALPNEGVAAMALRLAVAKAAAIAKIIPMPGSSAPIRLLICMAKQLASRVILTMRFCSCNACVARPCTSIRLSA
jgi:predicted house-cleaning NTP pyrophosphatase (Maf/HAM1 superfamily)